MRSRRLTKTLKTPRTPLPTRDTQEDSLAQGRRPGLPCQAEEKVPKTTKAPRRTPLPRDDVPDSLAQERRPDGLPPCQAETRRRTPVPSRDDQENETGFRAKQKCADGVLAV